MTHFCCGCDSVCSRLARNLFFRYTDDLRAAASLDLATRSFSYQRWNLLDCRRDSFRYFLVVESATPSRRGQDSRTDFRVIRALRQLDHFLFCGKLEFRNTVSRSAIYVRHVCRQRNVRRRYRHFILCVQKRKGFLLEVSYHPLATFCMAGMVPLSR